MNIELPVFEPLPQPVVPSALIVRYSYLRLIGEFPWDGAVHPGCGGKIVIRTRRGTEIAEVLTTACGNTRCAKSISREKMLDYFAASGGRDYPFATEGRALRVATTEDRQRQAELEQQKPEFIRECRTLIREMKLPMKLVEVEPVLGGEMLTFFFQSEARVDFRALVKQLASRFHTRIQMHQVGSRDEARLVADFETCGQHCCCRQFLKVLKAVNMGSAKMQKATLDPSKISGRCGRLKCCLRYEEQTYEELRKLLPRVGTRVRVADGVGVVEDTMILTQLVKVRLDEDGRWLAIANDEILERDIRETPEMRQQRESQQREREERRESRRERLERPERPSRGDRAPQPQDDAPRGRPPRRGPAIEEESTVNGVGPQVPEEDTIAPVAEIDAPPSRNASADPGPEAGASPEPPRQGGNPPPQRGPGMGSLGRRRRGRSRGRGNAPGSPPVD